MGYYFADYKKCLSGKYFFYENANSGLYDILVWHRETYPGDKPNVVLPASVSAGISQSILAAGYELRFYDILSGFWTDVDQVEHLIDGQTHAVICKHIFGIPAPVRALKSCTAVRNVLLIEDCTETLNSSWNGVELGTVGDCAIFDPAKLFQLSAGSFVVTRNKLSDFRPRYTGQAGIIRAVSELLRTRGKHVYYRLTRGEDPLGLAKIRSAAEQTMQMATYRGNTRKIGWLNKACICSVDLDRITQLRRSNYEYLLNGIRELAYIKPVVSPDWEMILKKDSGLYLCEGITPYSLPVWVPADMRNLLLKILAEKGIECEAKQIRMISGFRSFSQTKELYGRLLELPVHQGVNRHQLDRIINCMHICQNIEVIQTDKIRKAV